MRSRRHPACLEREWTETTARAAVRFAAGKGTAGLVAPPWPGLAESVLAAMLGDIVEDRRACCVSSSLVSGCLCFSVTRLADADDRPSDRRSHRRTHACAAPALVTSDTAGSIGMSCSQRIVVEWPKDEPLRAASPDENHRGLADSKLPATIARTDSPDRARRDAPRRRTSAATVP